jgi:hypothetical protein
MALSFTCWICQLFSASHWSYYLQRVGVMNFEWIKSVPNVTVPAIGVITRAGTVSPEGALAFHMMATLQGGLVGALAKLEGSRTSQSGIPFAIEGTTSNPKFVPETGGLAQGLVAHGIGNVAKGNVPGRAQSARA